MTLPRMTPNHDSRLIARLQIGDRTVRRRIVGFSPLGQHPLVMTHEGKIARLDSFDGFTLEGLDLPTEDDLEES